MPLWSRWMQMIRSQSLHPRKSPDIFLPLIDMTPSNPTCVLSTLEYLNSHAIRQGLAQIITFEHQLWWIAYTVIESQPSDSPLHNIILILGGFHTEMSFLATNESLMAGPGLKEIISQVYAEGSVDQMLSGKSVMNCEGSSSGGQCHGYYHYLRDVQYSYSWRISRLASEAWYMLYR